ncbi:uncharacterized protein SCODWIG_02138 [Saccharomycodes ludwigii]|uniref:Uncharacterized protein n=1 Tax=Saccharomycodes ludwigii TaxID=36035 RepID=A0A376B6P2_9ASCO|nr:uncharacterized protein SCODWIG_02138 [Saccharomycodes ludwigii]
MAKRTTSNSNSNKMKPQTTGKKNNNNNNNSNKGKNTTMENTLTNSELEDFEKFYQVALNQYINAKNNPNNDTNADDEEIIIRATKTTTTIEDQEIVHQLSLTQIIFRWIFKTSMLLLFLYGIKLYILYQVKFYSLYYLLPPFTYPFHVLKKFFITILATIISKVLPSEWSNNLLSTINGYDGSTNRPGVQNFEAKVIVNAIKLDPCTLESVELVGKLIQLKITPIIPSFMLAFIQYGYHLLLCAYANFNERVIVVLYTWWVQYHPQSFEFIRFYWFKILEHFVGYCKEACECARNTIF